MPDLPVSAAYMVAASMEKSAVRMYERLSLLLTGAEKACAEKLLEDEKSHLADFLSHLNGCHEDVLPDMTASVITTLQGEGILFPGGLVQAEREGMFTSCEAMLRGAIEAEARSVSTYLLLSEKSDGAAEESNVFKTIAAQEEQHRQLWLERLHFHNLQKNCGKAMD